MPEVPRQYNCIIRRTGIRVTKLSVDSTTLRVFRRVLLYYATVAFLVAAGQVYFERISLTRSMEAEIAAMARNFQPTLGNAIWNLDPQQVGAAAMGIVQNRYVSQVVIADKHDALVLTVSRDPDSGELVRNNRRPATEPTDRRKDYPLLSPMASGGKEIGTLSIYMDQDAIVRQLARGGIAIFLNTSLMALILSAVLMFFGSAYIARPIKALTDGVSRVSLATLGREPLAIDTAGNRELGQLQESFNALAQRLAETIASENKARKEIQEAQHAAQSLTLARELAEESSRMLHEILDNNPLPTFVLDTEHRVTHWNRACETILRIPKDAIIGTRDAWRAFHAEPRPVLADVVMRGDMERNAELEALYKGKCRRSDIVGDGYEAEDWFPSLERWLYFTAAPIRDAEGRIVGAIETLQDITARKQAEASIQEALKQQRELNAMKSQFVSMTSHEFRTPLATILSSAELLHYYNERMPPEERQEVVCAIETAVKRMTSMLEGILVIGRAEAGHLEFKPGPVRIKEACRRMAEESARAAGDEKFARLDYAADFQAETMMLDGALLGHILGNLLANAYKYSPENGTVSCRIEGDVEHLRIQVSDTGIGIPAADMPHVFDTFHRGGNVGNIPGTGLGMAIVKRAVDLHGGSITVESTAGMGAHFRIELPATAA